MSLYVKLLDAFEPVCIVECQVAGLFLHPIAEDAARPEQVLPKLRLTDAGKSNPEPLIIQRQKSATPAQQRGTAIDGFEVDDFLNQKRVAADNHDVPVNGGEMDAAVANQAIVRCWYADINPFTRIG